MCAQRIDPSAEWRAVAEELVFALTCAPPSEQAVGLLVMPAAHMHTEASASVSVISTSGLLISLIRQLKRPV